MRFIKLLSQERLEAMRAFDKENDIADIYTHLQKHYPMQRFNKKTGKHDGDVIMRKHRTKTGFVMVPLTRYCPPDRNEKAKAEAEAKAEREAAAQAAPPKPAKPATPVEEQPVAPKPAVEAPKPKPKPQPQVQAPAARPAPQQSVPLLEFPPLQ